MLIEVQGQEEPMLSPNNLEKFQQLDNSCRYRRPLASPRSLKRRRKKKTTHYNNTPQQYMKKAQKKCKVSTAVQQLKLQEEAHSCLCSLKKRTKRRQPATTLFTPIYKKGVKFQQENNIYGYMRPLISLCSLKRRRKSSLAISPILHSLVDLVSYF